MHFLQRLNAKAFVLLAAVAGSAIGFAQFTPPPAPTQAWSDALPGSSGVRNTAAGIDVDASGYVYLLYNNSTGSGDTAHLVKRGPANSLVWDVPVQTSSVRGLSVYQVLVSPKIGGVQYVYAIGSYLGGGGGFSSTPVWVSKLDTNGNDQWGGPVSLADMNLNTPVGAYADSSGDLYVAVAGSQGSQDRLLDLYDIDPYGGISAVWNRSIYPTSATYDPGTAAWFVTGYSSSDPTGGPPVTAMWGSFDRATGNLNFGGSSVGSHVNGFITQYHYTLDLLPGNHFAMSWNRDTYQVSFAPQHTLDCQLWVFDTQYNTVFTNPGGSSTSVGNIDQVAAYNTSSPIFVVGHNPVTDPTHPNQWLERYDWAGSQTFHRDQQPVGTLFPVADGFYDLFPWNQYPNPTFLEHYIDAGNGFYWGKSYPSSAGIPFYSSLKRFQNFFYLVLGDGAQGITLDRFVEGTCLSSVSMPPSFAEGSPVGVTINLNQPVPAGQTVTVSLYSSSANVTMPNGQRSQAFTLTAGQQAMPVTLSTAIAASSYGFTIQGLQNGIYRYAAAVAH